MITAYAFSIAVISGFALVALSALSVSLLDHWRHVNSEYGTLPVWTTNVPLLARVALVIPGSLFVISILSLRRGLISDRLLIHGISLTVLALAATTIFVIVAGLMPSFFTITAMPEP